MADIRIVWSPDLMTGDWAIASGGLDTTREIVTAIAVALFSWRLAYKDDPLPNTSTDRKGWWGDHEAAELHGGWLIGSRLWLLVREKQTEATRARAETYIREAIDPLVRLGLFESYSLTVDWFAHQKLGAELTLHRGPEGSIAVRFESLWDNFKSEVAA